MEFMLFLVYFVSCCSVEMATSDGLERFKKKTLLTDTAEKQE